MLAARASRARASWLVGLFVASAPSLALATPARAVVGSGVPIALNGAWWSGSAGFGTIPPTAYSDDRGIVHLWGAARQSDHPCGPRGCVIGTDPNLLGTIPLGPDVPQRNVFTIAHTNFGTYVDLAITPSGQILLIDPRPPAVRDYSFVSLEGISYDPRNSDSLNPTTQIDLNPNNWTPDNKFQTIAPAAYTDGDGTVHLEGAAVQWSTQSSAPGPDVLGSLFPGSLWPVGNVFAIAHTNFGTYADLVITGVNAPNPGEIILIGARPPAAQDLSFVSLEGITYAANPYSGLGPFGDVDLQVQAQNNWSRNNPFGANDLSGYEDTSGIVHLEGGLVQTSCCSAAGAVVAQVQNPSADPAWNVFELVHTNFGTYADVEIETDGTIHVIPPRAPAATDFGFLSLEGITFAAASPKFLGLSVHGAERDGATVSVTLRRPRGIAVQVSTVEGHRLLTVGVVRLGRWPAGRFQIHWTLRVNHRLLPPGRYQISLHALNGNALSVPAPPGPRTLIVLASGQLRVDT
jgi:hypothetical protein